MRRGPTFIQVLTPLSLSLLGAVCFLWLAAFALVWTSLNEFRAGRAFRSVLEAYGAGIPELASQRLPAAIDAKPRRYPYPRLLDGLLKIRDGKLEEARLAFQGVLDEKATLLTEREKALALNGLGVLDALAGKAERAKGGKDAPALLASAKDLFRQAGQAWPELPESDFNLAMLAWVEGDLAGCRKLLAQARDPSKLPPGADLARNLCLAAAALQEQKGAYEEAAAEVRRWRAYSPLGAPERMLLARALSRSLRAGPPAPGPVPDTVECEQLIDGLQGRDADRAETYRNAGIWKMEAYWATLRRSPEAALKWDQFRTAYGASLNRATDLAPDARELAVARAACWSRDLLLRPDAPVTPDEMNGGALPTLTALAAREDLDALTRARAENNVGWILATLGRGDEAAPRLEKASGLDPGDPLAPRNLGAVLDGKGDAAGACAWYRRSLAAKAEQPDLSARIAALEAKP